jgi:hypothetical protein
MIRTQNSIIRAACKILCVTLSVLGVDVIFIEMYNKRAVVRAAALSRRPTGPFFAHFPVLVLQQRRQASFLTSARASVISRGDVRAQKGAENSSG